MTRPPYQYARPIGTVRLRLDGGGDIELPVIPGILKHPRPGELAGLLQHEVVARKYTRLALEKAAWRVLREFPTDWLAQCLGETSMREGRRRALRYLMGLDPSPFATAPNSASCSSISARGEAPS